MKPTHEPMNQELREHNATVIVSKPSSRGFHLCLLLLVLLLGALPSLAGSRIIDILVVYTPAVTAYHGNHDGVEAHIQAAIHSTNVAFANSGIDGELRLAGLEQVNYTEDTASMQTDIQRLRNPNDGHLDEVHAMRDAVGADLVCLIRKGHAGGAAGVANLLKTASGDPSLVFSVVGTEYALSNHTFAHEIGHNLGASHARGDEFNGISWSGLFDYSYGHRFHGNSGSQFRTIMAYFPGGGIPYFSNPLVNYDGVATGVAHPSTVSADNAATFNFTIPVVAAYRNFAGTVVLANGVPVEGLAGASGSQRFFRFDVPSGASELNISISGGTGDADLYVRRGAPPTIDQWDYRPYFVGNNETVGIANPEPGEWHVMIHGYNAYSGVTLLASFQVPVTPPVITQHPSDQTVSEPASAQFSVSASGTAPLAYQWQRLTNGGSTWSNIPGATSASYNTGATTVSLNGYQYRCRVSNSAGTVFSNPATLSVIGTVILVNGVPVEGLAGDPGSQMYFRFDVPAGIGQLTFSISGGTGDADLYVRHGAPPTLSQWDYRPYLGGNNETVQIANPQAGEWYVMIHGYYAYNGVTLQASHFRMLANGVSVEGLDGDMGSQRFFRFDVPAGVDQLTFSISGGTGDADLYVRHGAPPTLSQWDYRPYLGGNNETVEIANPQAGEWYVMIRGFSAYNGVALLASYCQTLASGVPVEGLAGDPGSQMYFRFDVPAGVSQLTFSISGGTGDADLYVRHGAPPTLSQWDYRPYLGGNNETVQIANPQAGEWHVMIHGYYAYNGVTLLASYSQMLANGLPVEGLEGDSGSQMYFRIDVPAGVCQLTLSISGGTGDADLYVRHGAPPTVSHWDYRPYLGGNNETVEITNPQAGEWHVMIRGFNAYSGVKLLASYFQTLASGVPVEGLAGALGSQMYFRFDVPSGIGQLTFSISGGTGDADLYVRHGAPPTLSQWDYRPYLGGNNETVEITNPQAGEWHVMIRGYNAYSGVTLLASFQVPVTSPSFEDWINLPEIPVNLRGALDSAAGDGVANIVKYFQGIEPLDTNGQTGLRNFERPAANHLRAWFLRSHMTDSSVTGTVRWSRDLVNWHPSGATEAGVTVTLDTSHTQADATGSDREWVRVDALINGTIPDSLFLRLQVETDAP